MPNNGNEENVNKILEELEKNDELVQAETSDTEAPESETAEEVSAADISEEAIAEEVQPVIEPDAIKESEQEIRKTGKRKKSGKKKSGVRKAELSKNEKRSVPESSPEVSEDDVISRERVRSVSEPEKVEFVVDDSPEYNEAEGAAFAEEVNYGEAEEEPASVKENLKEDEPVPAKKNVPKKSSSKKKKKKKKKKRKRSRVPGILILTTFIFAISICLSMVIIAFGKDMLGIGKSESTHLIVIPEGATTEDISLMLKDEGIIKSPEFFQLFSRLRKSDSLYIPGEHFVRPNMAYETIISELTSIETEEQETVEITFPEGITIYDAAQILQEEGVCTAEDFIFYFNSGGFGFDFESRLPVDTSLKFWRMEGYLFPDTYFFYTAMDPEQVCQKIYLNFDNKMTDERYARMEALGLSLDQLITFASIVQKEAANTDTMTLVASVFWNRLRNSDIFPLLQSDPTSNYANDVIRRNMDVFDKTIVDAYDTYVGPGLPPGAICNPGIEAIDAVLEAFESDYFYFIANIYTGQTYFSTTLEEHEMYQEMVEGQVDDWIAASIAAEEEAAE